MKKSLLLLSFCLGFSACSTAPQVVEPPNTPQPQTTEPSITTPSTPTQTPVNSTPIVTTPVQTAPVTPSTPDVRSYRATEYATVYRLAEHGYPTASGIPYDIYGLTAAHASLPLFAQALVSRGSQQKQVTITDRLPAGSGTIKLSYQVAKDLGISNGGEVQVQGLAASTAANTSSFNAMSVNNVSPANTASVFLQAGAFADGRNAQQLQQQLSRQLPYPTIVQTVGQPAQLYRVRIGPVPATEVNQVGAQLRRYGINPMLIRQ